MPRRLLVITAAFLALLPAAAQAADSHAPKGARGDWLPRSEWVMSSWTPFDEARLYALLRTDRRRSRAGSTTAARSGSSPPSTASATRAPWPTASSRRACAPRPRR